MVRLLVVVSLLSLPALAEDYLVVTQDMPAGSPLTMDMLSQRRSSARIPGALTPDSASSVRNQRLRVALRKGDVLLRFALGPPSKASARCAQAP